MPANKLIVIAFAFALLVGIARADQTIPAGNCAGGAWGTGEVITLEGSINVTGSLTWFHPYKKCFATRPPVVR